MAAQQNVVSAMKGGILAVVAGVAAVVLSFMLVPLLSRIGSSWNR
jgi:malonate transporter MadL subunit